MEYTQNEIIIGVFLEYKTFDKMFEVIQKKIFDKEFIERNIDFIRKIEPYCYTILDKDYPKIMKTRINKPPLVVFKETARSLKDL